MRKIVSILIVSIFLVGCSSMPKEASFREVTAEARDNSENFAEAAPRRALMSPEIGADEDIPEDKPEVGIGSVYSLAEQTGQVEKYVKSLYYNKSRDLIAPFFLFESEDANAVNREIEAWIMDFAKEAEQNNTIHTTYSSIFHSGILSTMIQMDRNGEISFITYNFEVESGKLLGLDTVLSKVGIDWETARKIFWKDRTAFWYGIENMQKKPSDSLQKYARAELKEVQDMYEQDALPFILDEDGLVNFVLNLRDNNLDYYWQMYCISPNRTERLQRNAYSREFPMVVIPAPNEEELSNINIIKKIIIEGNPKNPKKHFLLVPLWESLNFSWLHSKEKEEMEVDRNSWQKNNLSVGEAISIEIDITMTKSEGFAWVALGDFEAVFSPIEHFYKDYSKEDIIYMTFVE